MMSSNNTGNVNKTMFGGFMFIVLAVIVVFFIYSQYKGYNEFLSSSPYLVTNIKDGTVATKIPSYKIQAPSDNKYGSEFTYSFWLFINDTNFVSGAAANCAVGSAGCNMKHIFHKGSNDYYQTNTGYHQPLLQSPGVWLYPNTNKLGINLNTYGSLYETCDIGNIPLNMWVNITIILIGNSVDVYVNGNLKKRQKLQGVPKLNFGDLFVSNYNGFLGYISRLRYFNYAVQPYILDEIYKNGPGTTFEQSMPLGQAAATLSPNYWMTTGYPAGLEQSSASSIP